MYHREGFSARKGVKHATVTCTHIKETKEIIFISYFYVWERSLITAERNHDFVTGRKKKKDHADFVKLHRPAAALKRNERGLA